MGCTGSKPPQASGGNSGNGGKPNNTNKTAPAKVQSSTKPPPTPTTPRAMTRKASVRKDPHGGESTPRGGSPSTPRGSRRRGCHTPRSTSNSPKKEASSLKAQDVAHDEVKDLTPKVQCLERGDVTEASPEFIHAVEQGNVADVVQLLASGVSPNGRDKWGHTPLHRAVLRNEPDALQVLTVLLDHGADVGAHDEWNLLPLHIAVRQRNLPAVQKLLACEPRADPLAGGKQGFKYNSIHEAVDKGYDELLDVLLAAAPGTEVFVKETAEGETLLLIACRKGRVACFETIAGWMQRAGMSLDAKCSDEHENTPLMVAAIHRNNHICKKLEALGVDKTLTNAHGETVFDILDRGEEIDATDNTAS